MSTMRRCQQGHQCLIALSGEKRADSRRPTPIRLWREMIVTWQQHGTAGSELFHCRNVCATVKATYKRLGETGRSQTGLPCV